MSRCSLRGRLRGHARPGAGELDVGRPRAPSPSEHQRGDKRALGAQALGVPKTHIVKRRTGRATLRLGWQLRAAHTTEEQRDHPDSAAASGEFDGWLCSVVYHK